MNRLYIIVLLSCLGATFCRSPDKGYSPLVCDVAKRGDIKELERLLSLRADPDAVDDAGTPALIWATVYNRSDVVRLLLDRKADVDGLDAAGRSALTWAGILGREEIAAMLVGKRADRKLKDKRNKSPYEWSEDRLRVNESLNSDKKP